MEDFSLVQPSGTFDTPDYNNASGGGFDWNSFASSAMGSLGDTFGGIAALVGATKGSPVSYNQYGQPVYAQQPIQQQQPVSSGISTVTIVVMVVFFIVLLVAMFLIMKSGK